MPIRNKKQQTRKPTVEEFLLFKPVRADYEWSTDEDGLVRIKVPKFESSIGKKFCRLIRKENIFVANMDEIGSVVWKHCDGKTTVKEILSLLEKERDADEDLDQRLFLFLQQMRQLRYIYY